MNDNNPADLSVDIRSLFAATVVAAELREPGDAALLLPAEAQFLGRAVPKRVQEFAAGRLCARRALAEFGIADFALRVADDRQPIWPDFLIGSITHTAGFCAAVVGERRLFLGLGLDCEAIGQVTADIWPRLFGREESNWIYSLAPPERAAAAAMIFTAKEAFYKSQYPAVGDRLDFLDLRIEPRSWDASRGLFEIHPVRALPIIEIARAPLLGAYRIDGERALSGVALTRR